MKYNIDYFIKFFTQIPKNKWTIGKLKTQNGKKCALGHCGGYSTKKSIALDDILRNTMFINDGRTSFVLLGKHPKTRILRALKNIKEKGSVL